MKPFKLGFCFSNRACVITCCLTPSSQVSGLISVVAERLGLRSWKGSSSDGRDLKNSTPAEKSLIAKPVLGSRRMPPGTEAFRKTPSGPSSLMARRIVNPPTPGNSKPPCNPAKKTRSSTGVVISKLPISRPAESSLMMPPIRAAFISPPNILPRTDTPMEAMSMMGNLPSLSSPISIFTPSMAPSNSKPCKPCKPVTAADKVKTKSLGSFCISAHCMPSSVIRIGNHEGHWKLPPVAEPTPRKTPKPGLVTKVPSPRKAKLRPSPVNRSDPIFTSAPTAPKLTSSSFAAAPVSSIKSCPVRVTKLPSVTLKVSTLNLNDSTFPSSNSIVARIASVSGRPAMSVGSAVVRSLMTAEIGRPGKKRAPPEAIKMLPSKSSDWPKVTEKFCTPIRMSSSSRMLPILIATPGVVCCAGCRFVCVLFAGTGAP